MQKKGRKSSFDTVILPNLEKIQELLKKGYSEKDVAKSIGVSYATWKKYKSILTDFSTLIYSAREQNIKELEKSMYMQALGFTKTIKKAMKIKEVEYEHGKKIREKEKIEFYEEEIYIPPSQSAGAFLLKNWAKNEYSNNPAELEQKREELEYKKSLEEW